MVRYSTVTAAIGLAAILALSRGARADVIDGNWCSVDGRHFSIQGSTIVTPAGTKTEGDYSRHRFSYTVPASEPSAGTEIFMVLINEFTVRLRRGDPTGPEETWKRCDVTS